MSKVVVFAGDRVMRAQLEADLAGLGFETLSFADIAAGTAALGTDTPDLILLSCPAATCAESVTQLKEAWQTEESAIILLVDPASIDSLAQDSRVDDVIFTPYDIRELAARSRLSLAKMSTENTDDRTVIGGLVIDRTGFEVRVDDRLAQLTYREYELLNFLASRRGRVFTRKILVEQIWEYDYLSGTRTVDVHIRRLRFKLGPAYGAMIETVRNVGYRFSRYDPP